MAGSEPVLRNQKTLVTPVTTGRAEGKTWLHWNLTMRVGFVRGHLAGFRVGNLTGCISCDKLAGVHVPAPLNEMPIAKCLASAPEFSGIPEYYANLMTQFYRTNPKDVGLNLRTLLALLSDNRTKTPAQIHAGYRGRRRSSQP
jgi:hypothetical protein